MEAPVKKEQTTSRRHKHSFPKGMLLDLDGTILIEGDSPLEESWVAACTRYEQELKDIPISEVISAIIAYKNWFWSDPERHKAGRSSLQMTRTEIAYQGLKKLNIDNHDLAEKIGREYSKQREQRISLLPGALEALEAFKAAGVKLALITNGAADVQRKKINKFNLERYFDAIFIEGEQGVGKPDPEIFHRALAAIDCNVHDVWAIGDNIEWEVRIPQSLGIFSIWIDEKGDSVATGVPMQPDKIIHALVELVEDYSNAEEKIR